MPVRFICVMCNFVSPSARDLYRHIAFLHTQHRPFLCPKCISTQDSANTGETDNVGKFVTASYVCCHQEVTDGHQSDDLIFRKSLDHDDHIWALFESSLIYSNKNGSVSNGPASSSAAALSDSAGGTPKSYQSSSSQSDTYVRVGDGNTAVSANGQISGPLRTSSGSDRDEWDHPTLYRLPATPVEVRRNRAQIARDIQLEFGRPQMVPAVGGIGRGQSRPALKRLHTVGQCEQPAKRILLSAAKYDDSSRDADGERSPESASQMGHDTAASTFTQTTTLDSYMGFDVIHEMQRRGLLGSVKPNLRFEEKEQLEKVLLDWSNEYCVQKGLLPVPKTARPFEFITSRKPRSTTAQSPSKLSTASDGSTMSVNSEMHVPRTPAALHKLRQLKCQKKTFQVLSPVTEVNSDIVRPAPKTESTLAPKSSMLLPTNQPQAVVTPPKPRDENDWD